MIKMGIIIVYVCIFLVTAHWIYRRFNSRKDLELGIERIDFESDMSVLNKNIKIKEFIEENQIIKVFGIYYDIIEIDKKIDLETCNFVYIDYVKKRNRIRRLNSKHYIKE